VRHRACDIAWDLQEFGACMQAETEKWARAIKAAGILPE